MEFLQTFKERVILVSNEKNILCYNVSTSSLAWNHSNMYDDFPPVHYAHYTDLFVVENFTVGVYPCVDDFIGIEVVNATGDRQTAADLHLDDLNIKSSETDTLQLYSYEYPYEMNFLLSKENSSKTILTQWVISDSNTDGTMDSFGWYWKKEIDRADDAVTTITDLNDDGWPEILAVRNAEAYVYGGYWGNVQYTTGISAIFIRESIILSDITGDGLPEVAFDTWGYPGTWRTHLVSLQGTQSSKLWRIEEDGLLDSVSDIDGDGYEDLICFNSWGSVYAIGGNDDVTAPTIERLSPGDGTSLANRSVTFQVTASDYTSGVDAIELSLDTSHAWLTYNEDSSVYEVTTSELAIGYHE
ncbi:MAG: VCBS repeat-containing protein [Candidatus Korarchaeota archaeon]|nr:VCBS repeat-containing protein [Candidatus Korarchaeota archaeon]